MAPKLYTVEVTHPAETPKGETTVRRNLLSRYALTETPHPAIRTIHDLVQINALRWGDNPCFGTRKVIKVHSEKEPAANRGSESVPEKTRLFWELGPFEYRSYKQVAREGLEVGSGLRKLGLKKGDTIAICAETSYYSVFLG
jgi:long-chain acyl-CoA synthetase